MEFLRVEHKELIENEKELLNSLIEEIEKLSDESLLEKVREAKNLLDNLFSIVFIGEFSTGKSSIINAIIGKEVLPEGITPTTDKITVLKYGQDASEQSENGNLVLSVQNEKLKDICIVDTPGTNVTIEQHEQITKTYIPKADIIFFVLGSERAVTATESRLIDFVSNEWKKNVVFILNKIDIVKDEEEFNLLFDHTRSQLRLLFELDPVIFPISSKLELEAIRSSDQNLNSQSGFDKLIDYMFETLSQDERIKIKLKSSTEIALSVCEDADREFNSYINSISEDFEKLNEFDTRINGMKHEIIDNSKQFTERIRSRLLEFKNRGIEFIDDLMRFENILKLIRKDKIARQFEEKVSTQTMKELEKDLDSMVNWTERSAKTLMDTAITFYRDLEHRNIKNLNTGFYYDRSRLIETIRSEIEKKKMQMDPSLLGGNLVDSARTAVASVLGVQVGSIAIGAAIVSSFSSLLIDITGIVTTIALVATAFAILPKKRRKAIKEFSEKVDQLTYEVVSSVASQEERDMDNLKIQILDSMMPIRNFYNMELEKIRDSVSKIEDIKKGLVNIEKGYM